MLTGWRAARQVLRKLSGEEGKIFDEVFDLEEMRKKAEDCSESSEESSILGEVFQIFALMSG